MARKLKLNRKAPFWTVHGHPFAKYKQDNKLYDTKGMYFEDVPLSQQIKPPKVRPAVQSIESKADEKKAAVLARAAKALAAFGGDDGAPDEIKDARKENARAAAAEENA